MTLNRQSKLATRRKAKRISVGQVIKLAQKLGVESNTVETAIAPRRGLSKSDAFTKLSAVSRDLEKAFQNDNEALQRWMHQPNGALDEKRPVELLEDGRIDILERVRDVITSLSFG